MFLVNTGNMSDFGQLFADYILKKKLNKKNVNNL